MRRRRHKIFLARVRGLPIALRRRIRRGMQLLNACFKNRMLLKVIMRVPGARVDPDINPDRVGYYAPIKRCIYCGKSGLTIKLTDEHILAYALGGDAILPEASCIECAKITNEVETYCANYIFRAVRVLHRTHRRKRNRQSISGPRPMATSRQRAGLLILPSFDPPGIVLGRAASDSFSGTMIHTWQITRDRRAQGWRGVPASFGSDMNLITFGRMIAKVAHCTAVAHYGIGSFRPWLIPAILDGASIPFLVGCATERLPDAVGIKTWARPEIRRIPRRGRKQYVAVFFRLYAYIGTPTYTAIAGEFIPWWRRSLLFQSRRTVPKDQPVTGGSIR
jgi:hypothetical protein